ncbi:MAG: hypothetical protein WAL85_10400 [Candidatus Korobacteraceae bacterium]
MRRCFLSLLFVQTLSLLAQQPAPVPVPAVATQASVRFSFDWSQGFPWQSYSITVQSDGKSSFNGTPHADGTNDTDPYQQEFTMSAANRQKIFDLAQKLNYFQGDFASRMKNIAQTGQKTLQYQSPQIQGSATYNWSQNADVEDLTRLFGAIAMTIDFGRKLTFQYRYDKLGMDKLLKELEDQQASHGVDELAIIAPMLRKIADDPNLMNISRQSAERLLHYQGQPAAPTPASQ